MSNPILLIVDDDPGIRTQLKWGLEGYEIITADSRINAIAQFDRHKPIIVTLDLGLPPDVDGTSEGFATLKQILQQSPTTKIVILSASEEQGNAEKAKSHGAYEYIHKPVKIDFLQNTIERAYAEYSNSVTKK